MRSFRKSPVSRDPTYDGQRRFEHWYRDNTVYFITARCRDGFPAFASDEAKSVFWDRFTVYTTMFAFIPWVATLLRNHYHVLGYLAIGDNLGKMMQRIHGSVAKLVNDLLPERREKFWDDCGNQTYFDGCIRNETQADRAGRYTLLQAVRCGLVEDYRIIRTRGRTLTWRRRSSGRARSTRTWMMCHTHDMRGRGVSGSGAVQSNADR